MIAVIEKYVNLPFSYGRDCCTFAAECVESLTGKNPMSELSYSNEREAYKIIRSHGRLKDAVTHFMGEPYDGHKDGDVALMPSNDGRDMLGVIWNGRILGRVKSGLMDYPIERATAIWCV